METFTYKTDGDTTEAKVERTLPRKIVKYLEKVGQFPKKAFYHKDNSSLSSDGLTTPSIMARRFELFARMVSTDDSG